MMRYNKEGHFPYVSGSGMSCRNSHNLFKSSRNGFEKITLDGTRNDCQSFDFRSFLF